MAAVTRSGVVIFRTFARECNPLEPFLSGTASCGVLIEVEERPQSPPPVALWQEDG